MRFYIGAGQRYLQISQQFLFCLLFLLLVNKSFSQDRNSLMAANPEEYFQEMFLPTIPPFQSPSSLSDFSIPFLAESNIWGESITFVRKSKGSSKFSFAQTKTELEFANLGKSNHYMFNMLFRATGLLKLKLGAGLLQQNTVLNAWQPNYQLVFKTLLEYEITTWLSSYIYGQFVSPSLTQSNFFDPLQLYNPMFLQNELGAGLRAKYKKVRADVGMQSNYGSSFNQSYRGGYFNSKITVGF